MNRFIVLLLSLFLVSACDVFRGDDGQTNPPVPDATDTGEGDDGGETDTTPPPPPEPEPAFTYHPPGDLISGSGDGAVDYVVYSPDMTFPVKDAPTFPQSQVYRFGGGEVGGDQCDPRNYEAPWRDNFCERRSSNYNSPFCPSPRVHLGQDIRMGTADGCADVRSTPRSDRNRYAIVAAEDGVISNVGSYTVNVRAGGRIYRYMHMNMAGLEVALGDTVTAGDTLGYLSDDFRGVPTTLHLHFEIKQNTQAHGWAYVPPYMSLVRAYERRENGFGLELPAETSGDDDDVIGIAGTE